MGLGILQPRNGNAIVPGTVTVYDSLSTSIPAGTSTTPRDPKHEKETTGPLPNRNDDRNSGLKYDRRKGPDPIILVPQPSDDPNDPLNWPLWKRDGIISILSITSVIASTLSPLLAANTVTLSLYFQRQFSEMALATGYHLAAVGVAGFLFVPSARVWGKRHLYILGAVLIIISSAWGGASGTNYKSLIWARVVQGIGLAPFEALVNASVGDLYFVHERGKRMAFSTLALFGGSFFTPVLVGKITHSIGWPWSFYLIAIFCGLMLPLIIFFCPETTYCRDARLNTDTAGLSHFSDRQQTAGTVQDQQNEVNSANKSAMVSRAEQSISKSDSEGENRQPKQTSVLQPQHRSTQPATPYLRTLAPFNGRKTSESYIQLLLRPLPLFLHPAILWAVVLSGTLVAWTVLIGVVLAAIFLGPPLWFDEVETGYMYVGPFVGALLGFALSGIVSDWSAKILTRRNHGIYEPEFRLVLVIPQLIVGCIGLYGFGATASQVTRYGWFWPDFFFALEVMGMVIGAVAGALYIVDAHRDIAVEAFTCLLMFKNLFSFGLTVRAYDWLLIGGIRKIFYVIGSVQIVICLLTIPMYILGKRNRDLTHRHDLLKLLHLR